MSFLNCLVLKPKNSKDLFNETANIIDKFDLKQTLPDLDGGKVLDCIFYWGNCLNMVVAFLSTNVCYSANTVIYSNLFF